MRLSTPLRLAALAVALVTSGAALSQSVPVKSGALAPPTFSIIHAGTLLAVPGTKPVSKATIAVENRNIKTIQEGMDGTWKSHFYDPDTQTNYKGEREPTARTEANSHLARAKENHLGTKDATATA